MEGGERVKGLNGGGEDTGLTGDQDIQDIFQDIQEV